MNQNMVLVEVILMTPVCVNCSYFGRMHVQGYDFCSTKKQIEEIVE